MKVLPFLFSLHPSFQLLVTLDFSFYWFSSFFIFFRFPFFFYIPSLLVYSLEDVVFIIGLLLPSFSFPVQSSLRESGLILSNYH